MHEITPSHEDNVSGKLTPIYLLEADVRANTIHAAVDISTIEGRTVTNTIQRVFKVYDYFDLSTRRYGNSLFGSTDGRIDKTKPISTPRQFLRESVFPDDGSRARLRVNIDQGTKDVIERHIITEAASLNSLLTGAVAYYGLLATHLYNEEDIYLKTLLPRKIQRFVITE